MAKSARERSPCAAGALSERLRRVSSWRSSAVSGRRGSFWRRDMGHLGARGSSHHYTKAHGRGTTTHYEHNAVRDSLGLCTPSRKEVELLCMSRHHSLDRREGPA